MSSIKPHTKNVKQHHSLYYFSFVLKSMVHFHKDILTCERIMIVTLKCINKEIFLNFSVLTSKTISADRYNAHKKINKTHSHPE